MRGLFAAIKDTVMATVDTEASITFGNEAFSITISGGYDVEARELSVKFHVSANFAKEGNTLERFFGTVDTLLAKGVRWVARDGKEQHGAGSAAICIFRGLTLPQSSGCFGH